MNTISNTSFLTKILSVGSFLAVVACAGEDPSSGKSQNLVTGHGQCADDEEEANDKINCSIDTDCDSDEICMSGKCMGLDGDTEDDECEADEDEGGADKITCAVDTDCDADEYCSNGLCTGLDGDDEADDAAEEPNDKITCSTNADCDADEVCTNGLCT